MTKALKYLGLAKKAGMLEIGEENTGAAIRWGKARFVLLASDASDNARRRLSGFLYEKDIPMLRVPFTKEEISIETGKNGCSMAAFTDVGFAHSFVQTLCDSGVDCGAIAERLLEDKKRIQKRRQEAKQHEKNKKFGKRRKSV